MQFVYHLGVHCTDEERLVRTLLRNRGTLLALGTAVPAPGRYRPIIRDTLATLKGGLASPEAQEALLDAVLDTDAAERVVFSNEFFLGMPIRAVGEVGLLPGIGWRAAAIGNLFPDSVNEFHIAMRNPATLIPALIAKSPGGSYGALMGDNHPMSVRWLSAIRRLIGQNPEARIVVWCYEDLPVIWPEVLRSMAGVGFDVALEGDHDIVQSVMTPAGFAKMQAFIADHPPRTIAARRKIVTAFLEKYARPEEMEIEISLPGWDAALVDEMTAAYDSDCYEIAHIQRVEMIQP